MYCDRSPRRTVNTLECIKTCQVLQIGSPFPRAIHAITRLRVLATIPSAAYSLRHPMQAYLESSAPVGESAVPPKLLSSHQASCRQDILSVKPTAIRHNPRRALPKILG